MTVIIGFVAIFVAVQLLFLLIYGIFVMQEVQTAREIPVAIQSANKLSVLPNLQIADLFCPVSSDILNEYQQQVDELLDNPNELVP